MRFSRPFTPSRTFFENPCEQTQFFDEPGSTIKSHEKTEDAASTAQADFTKDASKAPAADVVVESLRKLVAKKTELPLDLIHEDSRFLRDLHFNSIAVAEILAEASFQLRIPPLIAPLELADASLSQASKALQSRTDPVAEKQVPAGLDSWVRCFQVKKQLERLLASKQALQPATGGGAWTILGEDIPQARTLAQDLPGTGIAFVYKGGSTTDAIPSLLQVVSSLCRAKTDTKFLMICAGGSSASFARTVHLQLKLPTCVLHFPALERVSTGVVVAEAMALKEGYSEASYDDNFCRSQFFLQHGYQPSKQVLPDFGTLAKEDNLLVTGGGKGIAAEIAFKVAQQVGLSLVLMGRSAPSEDPELLENLARFSKAGINHTYVEADVAALEQVSRAIADGEERMGRITALLHGAGTNTPKLLASLDEADFKRTLAPKVLGMQNLLACLRQADLKLVAALGSIIAVSGMPGEAHYALANEWMGEILEAYGKRNALCRTLLIQSSIWSGVGMGQRLGRVESLLQQGITPISVDDGVRAVCELMQDTRATGPIIVSSRFGKSETVRLAPSRLPLSRFVDKIRVHYPGVELISDTEVSTITDPYVEDHIFEGTQLFPAVMGLEAMAQVSMALSGDQASITFFNVKFDRPISIPPNGTRQLRCATLARGSGEIEVALRSEETSFQVDHFKAICRITSQPVNGEQPPCKPFVSGPLFSAGEFYGDLFFQTGRFQRVVGYHSLSAFDCSVEIDANARNPFWFHRYRPQTLVLGDAGARDALLHSLQACIPDQKILPVAVKELWIGTTRPTGSVLISSRETFRTQDRLIHDVEVRDTAGTLLERWEGLELRVVRPRTPADWNPVLLGPYSERFMDGICRGTRVTFQDANAKSMTGSVTHRPDGKPETAGLLFLSRSHCGNILMEMSSQRRRVGCDIQSISPKSSDRWRTLLGAEKWALAQLICCEANEEIDYSATRVWCVLEALKKAGGQYNSPLVYDQTFSGGWVTLHSGTFVCATQIVQVAKLPVKIAFALLASTHNENLSIFS